MAWKHDMDISSDTFAPAAFMTAHLSFAFLAICSAAHCSDKNCLRLTSFCDSSSEWHKCGAGIVLAPISRDLARRHAFEPDTGHSSMRQWCFGFLDRHIAKSLIGSIR